jgi:hypothetical protein
MLLQLFELLVKNFVDFFLGIPKHRKRYGEKSAIGFYDFFTAPDNFKT